MSALATSPGWKSTERTSPRWFAEHRRLARQNRIPAQRAELHVARTIFADAAGLVRAAWIQNCWFAYRDERGRERLVGPHNLPEITGQHLTGACLVGAIVQAGGGLPAARTGRVYRALDLTWQALFCVAEPVGYCPAPALRTARVRELTTWNDSPSRTAGEVTTLLGAADHLAGGQLALLGAVDGTVTGQLDREFGVSHGDHLDDLVRR